MWDSNNEGFWLGNNSELDIKSSKYKENHPCSLQNLKISYSKKPQKNFNLHNENLKIFV